MFPTEVFAEPSFWLAVLAVASALIGVAITTDRPWCYVVGHPAPGSRYLFPTIYEGRAADVVRCKRCEQNVTVIR